MTCAEFQQALPYIIDSGGNAEQEAHLQSCPVCSDLVADLKYIAEVAKLLVPMEDPPARVWEGIHRSLEREATAARPTGPRGRLLGFPRSGPVPWVFALVTIAVLGFLLFYRGRLGSAGEASVNSPAAVPQFPVNEDQQILAAVSQSVPSLRGTFEDGIRTVNAYIEDADRLVQQDPNDEYARQALLRAYEQKTMLYHMALSHSLP